MRLFIAINFPDTVKERLMDIRDGLKEHALHGNFTLDENLHLTLSFLGEVAADRMEALRKAIDRTPVSPFALRIRGVGRFRRDGGDLIWAGFDENQTLTALQSRLSNELIRAGFQVERRRYTPHLTLARQVVLRDGFDLSAFSRGTGTIDTGVSKISLMKSERIHGKLTYTELK